MATDVSAVTSHFPSAEGNFATTTSGSVASGATTVGLTSVSGYANGEVAVFIIDPNDASKKQTFTGIVDTAGTQITGVKWVSGTNQTHSAGATVVDYASAAHVSMISKGLLVEHDQDGTHAAITGASADFTGAIATDTLNEHTAAAGVTVDGLLIKDSKLAENDSVVTANITDASVTSEKLNATIAVRAYRAAAESASTEEDIVFDTEVFDLGSNFNTTTGEFTAPVTGHYAVSVQTRITDLGDGNTANLRLYVNGVLASLSTVVGASAGGDPSLNISDVVSISAGQIIKATIEISTSKALTVSTSTTFIAIHFVGV